VFYTSLLGTDEGFMNIMTFPGLIFVMSLFLGTEVGLQVYTGNFLDGSARSSEGLAYRQGDGIALEPQLFPDSPNHPDYPSAVIEAGGTYRAALEWAFSAAV
jgi:galactose mutarotase-like enzyme